MAKSFSDVVQLNREKGLLYTIEHALTMLPLVIRARLTMLVTPPDRWPLYVDRYLLWYARGFERTYTYHGSFRYRVGPLLAFAHFMNKTKDMPGDIAEFGVYQGGSLAAWAKNVKLMDLRKHVYGFDSFEGYPDVAPIDTQGPDPKKSKSVFRGGLRETSYESVRAKIDGLGVGNVVTLVKGFYPESFKGYEHLRFCQVFIDCDLYEAHKAVLVYVYPRMVTGGIVMLEEYDDERFPGAKKALDEFLRDKPEKMVVIPQLRLKDAVAIAYFVKQ